MSAPNPWQIAASLLEVGFDSGWFERLNEWFQWLACRCPDGTAVYYEVQAELRAVPDGPHGLPDMRATRAFWSTKERELESTYGRFPWVSAGDAT